MTICKQLLDGVAVVDFGLGFAGALVSRMLADAGASTCRFEPDGGDPFYGLYSAYAAWQSGKKITVASSIDDALEQARGALAGADICIIGGEAFPDLHWLPDAEELARLYPQLVVLDISGVRIDVQVGDLPAVELLAQAASGMVFETLADRPMVSAMPVASYGAALEGVIGVMTALCTRQHTGEGQIVRTSIFDGALAWLCHSWFDSDRTDAALSAGTPKGARPLIFRCADGNYLHFALGSTNARLHVYTVLEIENPVPSLEEDPRGFPTLKRGASDYFGDIDLLQSYIGKWQRSDLLEALWARGIAAEAVTVPGEVWQDEQVVHNQVLVEEADGSRRVGLPFQVRSNRVPGAEAAARSSALPGGLPLAGQRIVDLGSFTAGPHSSMVLGDLGADVIKVEALSGDVLRAVKRVFTASSRGKRSLAVDMKTPEGREIIRRICASADMVFHNFRPGVPQRLGVDAESLHRLKPELILLENAGYGVSGPKAQRGGFDMILLALCGHECRAGGEGNPPACYATTIIDLATGFLGAIAALMAQFIKQRTGAGAVIETSLLNTGLFLLSELVQSPSGEFLPIATLDARQTGFHPAERLYQTSDGSWIAIAARGPAMASRLLSALGLDGRIHLHRDDWAVAEADLIAAAVAQQDSVSLLASLASASVWATLCRDDAKQLTLTSTALREAGGVALFEDPRYGEVRQIGPLFSLSKVALRALGAAPEIGQHTPQILGELGYSDEQIATLIKKGVVGHSQTG